LGNKINTSRFKIRRKCKTKNYN